MIVYVVLNSKFKDHLLQTLQDFGTWITCHTCSNNFHKEKREHKGGGIRPDAHETFIRLDNLPDYDGKVEN